MPSPQELWQFIFGSQSDPQQSLDRLRVKLGNLVASPRDTAQGIASLMPAALYGAIRPGAQVDPASSKSAALERLGQLPGLRQFGAVGDAIAGPGREASGGSVSPGLEMLLSAVPGGFIRMPQGALGKASPARLRTAAPLLHRLIQMVEGSRVGPGEKALFHGTPHEFSRFDASRVGTGQGAAAFGPGFYTAENPEVALSYFKGLQRKGGSGGVKTVAIPKELEPKMLDWDMPLADQTNEVKRSIDVLGKNTGLDFSRLETGKQVYFRIAEHAGAEDYVSAGEVMSGIEEYLDTAGFAGIRYFDRGSRVNEAGKATRNYVLLPRIAEEHARVIASKPPRNLGVLPSGRRKPDYD